MKTLDQGVVYAAIGALTGLLSYLLSLPFYKNINPVGKEWGITSFLLAILCNEFLTTLWEWWTTEGVTSADLILEPLMAVLGFIILVPLWPLLIIATVNHRWVQKIYQPT